MQARFRDCSSWPQAADGRGVSATPSTVPVSTSTPLTPEPEPRDARLAQLLGKAKALPKCPGVYLMKDVEGQVIYVGKAAVLPNRVSSYFIPSADLGFVKQPLLEAVADFDVIECESEWEAMLMESRLIKDTRPRFNV